MRLISRRELMYLPSGSIISEGEKYVADNIFVFEYPLTNDDDEYIDYVYTRITDAFDTDYINGSKFNFDSDRIPADLVTTSRDGMFNHDATYWLWEKDDLIQLKTVIDRALQLHDQEGLDGNR